MHIAHSCQEGVIHFAKEVGDPSLGKRLFPDQTEPDKIRLPRELLEKCEKIKFLIIFEHV